MSTQHVFVMGGTGRTGQRLVSQLLERGVQVRAVVRSRSKLPAKVLEHPGLTLIEADLLSLSDEELQGHLRGCDAVLSCLGHVLSLKGIFGAPRDLVERAVVRACRAIEALRPEAPVKVILMTSVSVNRPRRLDTHRGAFERAFLWLLRALLPPARDNQRAADVLFEKVGPDNPFVHWAVVRPDSLKEGDVTEHTFHEGLVDSVFSPGETNMANVAHAMCELATNPATWAQWRFKAPVVVNAKVHAR